jgi:hypothetical protein
MKGRRTFSSNAEELFRKANPSCFLLSNGMKLVEIVRQMKLVEIVEKRLGKNT